MSKQFGIKEVLNFDITNILIVPLFFTLIMLVIQLLKQMQKDLI